MNLVRPSQNKMHNKALQFVQAFGLHRTAKSYAFVCR
jgi:hypothetical protein